MSLRKLLILFLVVAALGVGIFVVLNRKEAEVRRERRDARLLEFDERNVTAVVVTTAGTEWRFDREGRGWRVTSPIDDAANNEAVADLISACERVPVIRVLDDPEALSAYGLDPPVARIRLEGVDAALDLGTMAPTGDGLFARVDGRPGVLLLEPSVLTKGFLTDPNPLQFRDPSFTGLARVSIDRIDVRTRAGEVRLAREAGGWWIVEPRRLPASGDAVEAILETLDRAEIGSLLDGVDPDDPALGLLSPAVEIDLSSDDSTRRFRVSAETPDGRRLATRDDRGCVMEISIPGLDSLPLSPVALATRRLSAINRYRIESFVYTKGEESLSAKRSGESWSTDGGAPLTSAEIYEFLTGLLETPVRGWRDSNGPAASAVAELRYRLEGGAEGRIEFLPGGLGRDSEVSGIVFELGAGPPSVPQVQGH